MAEFMRMMSTKDMRLNMFGDKVYMDEQECEYILPTFNYITVNVGEETVTFNVGGVTRKKVVPGLSELELEVLLADLDRLVSYYDDAIASVDKFLELTKDCNPLAVLWVFRGCSLA